MSEASEKCIRTVQVGIDSSASALSEVNKFCKTEQEKLDDFLEFGPFYRDITEIVENEATVQRKISRLQKVSQNFDRRGEKKLQSSLAEQLKATEHEILKQKQFNAIQVSQLSHVETALDGQAACFETEYEASNVHIKKLQEERNALYVKEMTLRKNIQRMTATLNARAKRANAKGGA
jgi:hypothetical protein